MKKPAALILIIFFSACETPRPPALPAALDPTLPTLSRPALPRPQSVPGLEEFPPPPRRSVTLAWENAPLPSPENYVTGLEGTTNFRDWYEVARLPYATAVLHTLTNRPPAEFYRAFNALSNP